jgi:hypothetical protein
MTDGGGALMVRQSTVFASLAEGKYSDVHSRRGLAELPRGIDTALPTDGGVCFVSD